MGEVQEVRNISVGRAFEVSFEQSAVKGVTGFKVVAHSDDADEAMSKAKELLWKAAGEVSVTAPENVQ